MGDRNLPQPLDVGLGGHGGKLSKAGGSSSNWKAQSELKSMLSGREASYKEAALRRGGAWGCKGAAEALGSWKQKRPDL